tara:strand:+ start:8888 stop:9079 length:192 start_codon:yes stop_codon:yes gene_type:complete
LRREGDKMETNKQECYSPKRKGSRFSEFVRGSFFKLAILPLDVALRADNARYEAIKSDWGRWG